MTTRGEEVQVISNDKTTFVIPKSAILNLPDSYFGQVLSNDPSASKIEINLNGRQLDRALEIYRGNTVSLTGLYHDELRLPLDYMMIPKQSMADAQAELMISEILPSLENCSGPMRATVIRQLNKSLENLKLAENKESLMRKVGSLGFLDKLLGNDVMLEKCSWDCRPCGSDRHSSMKLVVTVEKVQDKDEKMADCVAMELYHVYGCGDLDNSYFKIGSRQCGSFPQNNFEYEEPQLTVAVARVRQALKLPKSVSDDEIQYSLRKLNHFLNEVYNNGSGFIVQKKAYHDDDDGSEDDE
jgi:hypothetical protein